MDEKSSKVNVNHGSLLSLLGNVLVAIPTLLALTSFIIILAVVVYYGWGGLLPSTSRLSCCPTHTSTCGLEE
ncbi:MAG: hypothetical protein QW566_09680 [Candidatus Jordarchaeales archaeon]